MEFHEIWLAIDLENDGQYFNRSSLNKGRGRGM